MALLEACNDDDYDDDDAGDGFLRRQGYK